MVLKNHSREKKGHPELQMRFTSKEKRLPHTYMRHLTLEMVLLSCPVIPDKSASKLKMLVRPMWGSISSRLYDPEMENLGKCKSNRLERESEKWGGLIIEVATALSVAA